MHEDFKAASLFSRAGRNNRTDCATGEEFDDLKLDAIIVQDDSGQQTEYSATGARSE